MDKYYKEIIDLTAEHNINEIKRDLVSKEALRQLYSLDDQRREVEADLKLLNDKAKDIQKKKNFGEWRALNQEIVEKKELLRMVRSKMDEIQSQFPIEAKDLKQPVAEIIKKYHIQN